MSEQKYYVRLKLDGQLLNSGGFYDDELGCDEYNEFTKSELAEMMDGALYKPRTYKNKWIDSCECESCEDTRKYGGEWINPLIELVPVEDNE